jgi:hypothetical protein
MKISLKEFESILMKRLYNARQVPYSKHPQIRSWSHNDDWKEAMRSLVLDAKTGKDKFAVINLEAGLGKSVETNNIIISHLLDSTAKFGKRFLIVKLFEEEVYDCVNIINSVCPNKARAITASEWKEYRKASTENIVPFDVVVITHSRYKDLCEDDNLRSVFTQERHVLIIDEKINFPVISFNDNLYRNVLSKLDSFLHAPYFELCAPLLEQMEIFYKQGTSTCWLDVNCDLLARLRWMVETSIRDGQTPREVLSFFDDLKVLATQQSMFSSRGFLGNNICVVNPIHRLWGLDNNIILDASASIDYSYRVSDRFKIQEFRRTIDHSLSYIYQIKCATSYSSIYQSKNEYLEKMGAVFKERYSSNKKALIIVHKKIEKEFAEYLKHIGFNDVGIGIKGNKVPEQSIIVDHFGNILGRNKYRDFDQCWILGTFNLPVEAYVWKWFQASDNSFEHDYEFERKKWFNYCDGVSRKFDDYDYEATRKGHLISEFYQASKRVQRNSSPRAEIFIAVKEQEIFDKVVRELPSIRVGTPIELSFSKKKENSSKTTKVDALLEYLQYYMHIQDKHRKKDIRIHPSVLIDERNFSSYLKHPKIRMWFDAGMFEDRGQYIIKLKDIYDL